MTTGLAMALGQLDDADKYIDKLKQQNVALVKCLQEAVDLVYSAYSDKNKGLADMDTKEWRYILDQVKEK